MEYCSNGSLADLISKRKTENKPFSYTVWIYILLLLLLLIIEYF
jgi:uncharacterized membrane protein YsdA (DUF1294 family)